MRVVRIAARKSDLARLQAYAVGDALQKTAAVRVEYLFKESLGDKNLHDPLWKMPERGVFTEDFLTDLRQKDCDIVVHSWKDLPTEERSDTQIIATLPRADSRDLFLLRKDSFKKKTLRIFSSSPRREYNCQTFLSEFLPFQCQEISFIPVRGNIPTRVKKLFSGDADALILAKAALDRLLSETREEFQSVQNELRKFLGQCHFMVLPLSQNPSAAAQGALAIESLAVRSDLKELFAPIHCSSTWREVVTEREVLRSYGGGCHQKIGVSQKNTPLGTFFSARGESEGKIFERVEWTPHKPLLNKPSSLANIWPRGDDEEGLFTRSPLATQNPQTPLWVAKAEAMPKDWNVSPEQLVWTSGLKTWKSLAERGVWVHGSQESLGEGVPPLDVLVGNQLAWTKLTHASGYSQNSRLKNLATYELNSRGRKQPWENVSHFYWGSASAFEEALRLDPSILNRNHSCGLGNTYKTLQKKVSDISAFLSYNHWRKSL